MKLAGMVTLLTLAGAVASAQPLIDRTPKAVALAWLLSDCGVDNPLAITVREAGVALTEVFLEALDKGPAADLVGEVERSAARGFEQRQVALKEGTGLGLSPEDLEIARRTTRDEYIARAKQNFDRRYRSQAVAGLGIVGGPKARTALERLAADKESALQGSAQTALAALKARERGSKKR